MACDSPFYVLPYKGAFDKVPVPCGRCPPCKFRRVNEWVFRLLQEDKVSTSAHFVTLTYDTDHVPISENGFMTLRKSDLQKYFKRLRKLCPDNSVRYYAVGEYGTKNKRPHYHAIVFNVPDTEMFSKAWSLEGVPIGTVHVGFVSGDSVAYTLKYIDKSVYTPRHKRDDRLAEFSLMSKGLGSCYLTPEVVAYHRNHSDRLYTVKNGGTLVPMSRYYRTKIWNESEREQQVPIIQSAVQQDQQRDKQRVERLYPNMSYDEYLVEAKHGRARLFQKQLNKERDV